MIGRLQARSQDFCWGGGGGGGGYLRPNFVRFEDSLLGKKPSKGEGCKDNNSGTFLNSKRSFRKRTL